MSSLERRLTRIVQIAAVLGALACMIGLLPGERVYEDSSHCFGRGLGSLFVMEHGSSHQEPCEPTYDRLVETRAAGGGALIACVAMILGFGYVLYRDPRRLWAWLWPLWTLGILWAYLVLTFKLDLFEHVEILWPTHVVGTLGGALVFLIFPIAPIVALVSDHQRPSVPPIARARVRDHE